MKGDPSDSARSTWLASLKVGDKVAWLQYGQVRGIYVIERETPKHWSLRDGWLVSKESGRSTSCIGGVRFEPYVTGMEARMARQKRIAEIETERRDLLVRIARFSTARLRIIATGVLGTAPPHPTRSKP